MFLTRDRDNLGNICIWVDVQREDLSVDESGEWCFDEERGYSENLVLILSPEDYKLLFKSKLPRKGSILEISRVVIEE